MAKQYSFAVPFIVGCAQFMHQFDGTAIATALPSMAATLHETPLRLNLAISCYLLSLAVFVPISGWLADRYGARQIFMLAITIFTVSSVLCGLSHNLLELVLARIVQGLGGAMMTPVGRVIVAKSVPRSGLVKAMNYITIPGMLAPVLGPSVGGLIVTYFSWPWVFFVNLPIGVAGVLLVRAYVPDLARERVASLDSMGFVFSSVALAGFVFGFESMGRGLLPAWLVVCLLTVGVVCGFLYLIHSRRVAEPIVDLGLMRFRSFSASITGGSLFYVTTTAVVFLLAVLFQVGFGYSAFHAGLILLGTATGSVVSRAAFPPALKLFGFRRLLLINVLVISSFLFCCGLFRAQTPLVLLLGFLFFGGLARSMLYASIQSLSYAEMPRPLMSRATSFAAMVQQFMQSFGVGLVALAVHFSLVLHGRVDLTVGDLKYGFWLLSALSFLSVLVFLRLPASAGAALEGRGSKAAQ
ncbi:MAG TPA: MFS transporter [Stellaceae bacterium]|jgi:EmrB/QacA subfamily drug resistance transporter|nr:MFS transporter [Stellaceae bacterium]